MNVGEKIKAMRIALCLTQTDLGKKLGVERKTVSKWERNSTDSIPLSKIQVMAALFDVAPSYLTEDES